MCAGDCNLAVRGLGSGGVEELRGWWDEESAGEALMG